MWDKAYEKLREDDPSLIEAYETDILAQQARSHEAQAAFGRQEMLQCLAQEKLAALHDTRLRVTVGKKQIVVRDQVHRIFKATLSAGELIEPILSAQPGAAAAWGGLLVVVPVGQGPPCHQPWGVTDLRYPVHRQHVPTR